MEKFWMLLVEGTKESSKQHLDKNEAMTEAERLLKLNQGKKVYLLGVEAACHYQEQPIIWEDE